MRSIPRPESLARPLDAKGQTAKGLASLGHRAPSATCSSTSRTPTATARDARTIASLGVGEEATVAVAVRSVVGQADARPPPQARRGARRRRDRADGGRLVQPAVAGAASSREGTQVLLHGSCASATQFRVTEHELVGAGAAPACHTHGLCRCTRRPTGCRRHAAQARLGATTAASAHVVEPLPGCAARWPSACPTARRAVAAIHFPDRRPRRPPARRRLAFEELFLLELALAGRRRARREGRRAPAAGSRPASWWTPGSSRCRST